MTIILSYLTHIIIIYVTLMSDWLVPSPTQYLIWLKSMFGVTDVGLGVTAFL